MNIKPRIKVAAYALVIVMGLAAAGLTVLTGALKWTSSNASMTDRNNSYFNTTFAAEAASEKVLTKIRADYLASGEGTVYSSLDTYRSMVPTTAENSYWSNYQFKDVAGTAGKTYVARSSGWLYTNIANQYAGLKGLAASYVVISDVTRLGMVNPITAAVRQELQVASIPLFQFAIFYGMDLEINPGPNMDVTGRVHSNANIYIQPQATLNFLSPVTSVLTNYLGIKSPLDPTSRTATVPHFIPDGQKSGQSSLTLPIGTNNTPTAVRAVLAVPPAAEDKNSLMGQQRYYNKADLVLIVTNGLITATSGSANNFATTITPTEAKVFLNTNMSFYNKREGKTVVGSEIDVAKLKTWSASNTVLRATLGRDVQSVYIIDKRTQSGTTEPGVKLINGQTLPSGGLTVATPDPIYIKGNYNAPAAALGTHDTSGTKPASIVADAITVLSTAWVDSTGSSSISSRIAASTTVNAAILAGIVPSNGTAYSGGVENFPRFLEDWGSATITYTGSMVVMFPSQYAVATWGGSDVYSPPTRNWAFDVNFMDATKLPPGTPQILTVVRVNWAMISPGSTY